MSSGAVMLMLSACEIPSICQAKTKRIYTWFEIQGEHVFPGTYLEIINRQYVIACKYMDIDKMS